MGINVLKHQRHSFQPIMILTFLFLYLAFLFLLASDIFLGLFRERLSRARDTLLIESHSFIKNPSMIGC